jgi:uncharacterized protein (TIGR03435 family)
MRNLLLIVLVGAVSAQAQNSGMPEFEVASVRPSSPDATLDSYVPTLNIAPGATLRIANRQLKELIMIAYGVGGRQLAGPGWLIDPPGQANGDVPRFDIIAKVPSDASRDQIPSMLQNLLADRFKLKAHREPKPIVIYALSAAKSGLKIKPLPDDEKRPSGCSRNMFGTDGVTTATCQNMTPAQLAQQLQTLSPAYFREGPIVDQTGLTQSYDFTLAWITIQQRDAGEQGPSMFDAVDKLGLHLERQKGTAEVLVVDQVEKTPAEN